MSKNYNLCPRCKQDMRTFPHDGFRGKFCSLCGQGLQWRKEMMRQRKLMARNIRIVHALANAKTKP